MLNLDQIREYCLGKKSVTEEFPFDEVTLVFKVAGKMFALIDIDTVESLNLKCDPEKAIELRASHPDDILPGYHMNKKHWNTVKLNRNLDNDLVKSLIDHSYQLVYDKLPKIVRQQIG